MSRQYKKITINREDFAKDASSGLFTPKELAIKYGLLEKESVRRIYYFAKKFNINIKTAKDYSYITDEYKQKISKATKGIKRTPEQIENYKKAAKKRGNNRLVNTYKHSEETKAKIKASNLKTYQQLPINWLEKCIHNPEWFLKLRKVDYSKLNEWEKYVYDVRSLSYRNARKYKNLISGEKKDGNHLDHILSISEAFNNQLEIEIAASYHNLRYIPAKENLQKNSKSELTIEELKQKYYANTKK